MNSLKLNIPSLSWSYCCLKFCLFSCNYKFWNYYNFAVNIYGNEFFIILWSDHFFPLVSLIVYLNSHLVLLVSVSKWQTYQVLYVQICLYFDRIFKWKILGEYLFLLSIIMWSLHCLLESTVWLMNIFLLL